MRFDDAILAALIGGAFMTANAIITTYWIIRENRNQRRLEREWERRHKERIGNDRL